KLVALYPHPTKLYPAWQVGAALAPLMLVTALGLRARDQRYLAVGWFWFLGSRSGNGRSCPIPSLHWPVFNVALAGGRLGKSPQDSRQMARHSRRFLSA